MSFFVANSNAAIFQIRLNHYTTICDELDIAPTLFYRWQKELFENGHTLFENGRKAKAVEDAKDEKIQKLEAKLQKKNEVMAELMEALTDEKKRNGAP